ncbi:YpmP family protein [Halalkalibacterium halodurans]|uniref:YpmP family protein n=1 Tax=Halalkalibacterium halodurans TaxID=86665 RepID=UPI002E231697|nr:YpmP family protein [Halalkalibacterium halodurans]
MIYKRLEFKNMAGQKVKITDIPVLDPRNPHYFLVHARLQALAAFIYNNPDSKTSYSFHDYLKRKMKWSDFIQLYRTEQYSHNA